MSKEFKVGDKVYCPELTTKICKLENCSGFENYPVCIYFGNDFETFTSDGFAQIGKMQSLFHATPENHELLEKLYGVEFEKPPTSREIIKALLGKGYNNIPCWVSEDFEPPTHDDKWVFIAYCDDTTHSEFPYTDSAGYDWKYATPFDITTGEAITELPK